MTIYVLTYHAFNHEGEGRKPLDPRFLESKRDYVYYLIDSLVPKPLEKKEVLFEEKIDRELHEAGGRYFAEWSFLLAEAKHSFCRYPFFMISSRFYEKNRWLLQSLDEEWERLFGYLQEYGWGFLPSYNRPLRWIDTLKPRSLFSPFTPFFYTKASELFDIPIPQTYRYVPDLFCNYIGFRSRKELLEYVNFYRPLLDHFFDSNYRPRVDLDLYVQKTGKFRNEKPFTFLVEALSHLFFYQTRQRFFALHYNGYYTLDLAQKQWERRETFPLPLTLRCYRALHWQMRRTRDEIHFLTKRGSKSQ